MVSMEKFYLLNEVLTKLARRFIGAPLTETRNLQTSAIMTLISPASSSSDRCLT